MRVLGFCLLVLVAIVPSQSMAADFAIKQSAHGVAETVERFIKVAESKGLKIFARIDHAKGAKSVNQTIRPAQVVLFGHPKLGTALMKAEPKIGLDLPLKVLVYEDVVGKTWLVYAPAATLKARYGVSDMDKAFNAMAGTLKALIINATQ